MRNLIAALALFAVLAVGCSSPTPSPTVPSPAASAAAPPLAPDTAAVPPGRYDRTDLLPGVSFELEDGWSTGGFGDGSLVLRTTAAEGDVTVRLVRVEAETAAKAASAVQALDGVETVAASDSRMSGLTGPNVELEHDGDATVELLATKSDPIRLEPGERAWLSMFDAADGVLAIAVISDAATWDAALLAVEPFLESVSIDG